jgi:hypothetical protein
MRGILQDSLTQLRNGDVATDVMTGRKVMNCYGLIGYAIPVEWNSDRCSTLRIDVATAVTELIGKDCLSGNWVLPPKEITAMPQDLLYTD